MINLHNLPDQLTSISRLHSALLCGSSWSLVLQFQDSEDTRFALCASTRRQNLPQPLILFSVRASKHGQCCQHPVAQNCAITKGEEIKPTQPNGIISFLSLWRESFLWLSIVFPPPFLTLPLFLIRTSPHPLIKKTAANFCIRFLSALHLFIVSFQNKNFNFIPPSALSQYALAVTLPAVTNRAVFCCYWYEHANIKILRQ